MNKQFKRCLLASLLCTSAACMHENNDMKSEDLRYSFREKFTFLCPVASITVKAELYFMYTFNGKVRILRM